MTMRPVPQDPGASAIREFIDLRDDTDLLLLATGEWTVCAFESMREDGSGWQPFIMLEVPTRRNHTDQEAPVRLACSPEDAFEIAGRLLGSAAWLLRHLGRDVPEPEL